jgi:teichuronic acid biosynthesis glycosyltransferase TuaG
MVKVSIIMPCYNSEKHINQAVISVLNQSYKSWELLICDDGSTDQSAEIIKKWAQDCDNIFVFNNRFKKGASGARNTCLAQAKGRYIAFLDSDDIWLPMKLEQQIRFMKQSGASFVFGYCQNISEQGIDLSVTKAPKNVSFSKIFFSNFIPCLTVIYDSKVLGKVEQPNIKKRNDYALWLRILRANPQIEARCYPEVVARYRVNNYGLSANKLSGIKYFYRCLRRHAGLNKATAGFCTFLAIGFKGLKTLSPRMYNLVVTKLL